MHLHPFVPHAPALPVPRRTSFTLQTGAGVHGTAFRAARGGVHPHAPSHPAPFVHRTRLGTGGLRGARLHGAGAHSRLSLLASSTSASTVVIDFIIAPLSRGVHARLTKFDTFQARTLPPHAPMLICIKPSAVSTTSPGDTRRAG
jgi:hypothetical protein